MPEPLPTVLVPGLLCSARLYADQIPVLWQFGPVTVADHTRDDNMSDIAKRIVATATPEQSERRRTLIDIARRGLLADVTDRLWPLLVHRNRRRDARLLSIMQAMTQETGVEAFVRQQTAIIGRVDSRPTLAAIRCPTLVLVGDGDELIPPDRSEEIANSIAGARYVVVPESGHMSTLEQPDAVNRALVEWMKGA
jgi:pimeloyl-ACP methyl ester carboxylesterase